MTFITIYKFNFSCVVVLPVVTLNNENLKVAHEAQTQHVRFKQVFVNQLITQIYLNEITFISITVYIFSR